MFSERDLVKLLNNILNEKDLRTPDRVPVDPASFTQKAQEFDEVQAVEGLVWVEQGEVHVINPKGAGRNPSIIPGEGVIVRVNGREVKGRIEVTEEDRVELEGSIISRARRLEVSLSRDKLKAILKYSPAEEVHYSIRDFSAATDLILEADEEKTVFPSTTFDEIILLLENMGINYGQRYQAIKELLEEPQGGSKIVAEGEPPGETVDESVELKFSLILDKGPLLLPNGLVDFRECNNTISVEAGVELAVKRPSVLGKPGINVFGEPVLPREPKKVIVRAGSGTTLSEDGFNVTSNTSGRPTVERVGTVYLFRVEELLYHLGDVDIKSGNIRFRGSVEITGNVVEGMKVSAAGNVKIRGLVTMAQVSALGDIYCCGNVVSSTVITGTSGSQFQHLSEKLKELAEQLEDLLEAINIVFNHPTFKNLNVNFGHLFRVLIETKFPSLLKNVNQLDTLVRRCPFDFPPEIESLLAKMKSTFFLGPGCKTPKRELLHLIQKEVLFLSKYVGQMKDREASIFVPYALNSQLEATKEVVIYQNGCVNTSIYAGSSIKVKKAIRGGNLKAGRLIVVQEAGSDLETPTFLSVGDQGIITAEYLHPGVVLQVNGRKKTITKRVHNVTCSLGKDGEIVITRGQQKLSQLG